MPARVQVPQPVQVVPQPAGCDFWAALPDGAEQLNHPLSAAEQMLGQSLTGKSTCNELRLLTLQNQHQRQMRSAQSTHQSSTC